MERNCSIHRDFKTRLRETDRESRPAIRRPHLLGLASLLAVSALVLGITPDHAAATRELPADVGARNDGPLDGQDRVTASDRGLALPPSHELQTASESSDLPQGVWRTTKVRRGDNLSLIFGRLGLSAKQLQQILDQGAETKPLKTLYPGDEIRLNITHDGLLEKLVYAIDETRTLEVMRQDDGFVTRTIERALDHRLARARSTITDSLFLAGQQAGLSDRLTMELAGIFGWDIDFALDIRAGDSFTVIYEELYQDGRKIRDGNILAAEFVNRGQSYRAIRYEGEQGNEGYFTPEGQSLRKAFLRSPLAVSRISSRFSLGRKHPILNKIRAHKGVDYAAATGTPVRATGDGKIAFRGDKGGYGRTVVINHGSSYSTLYAHLSSYARGMYNGKKVRQGQVIGYVGKSGLATGPHLHYEFLVKGVHRNPLTVRLPDAAPLRQQYMADFTGKARPFLAQLDVLGRMPVDVAARDPEVSATTTLALNRE